MNQLTLQLITTFIVGGIFVAFLSLIVERVNKQISGIILGLPITSALAFFFLGWTLTPEIVSEIAPSSLIPLGLSILIPPIYAHIGLYFEKVIKNKYLQILSTLLISLSIWLILDIPLIFLKLNNLLVELIGSLFLLTAAHYLISRKNFEKPVSLIHTPSQKIARAVIIGFVISIIVFLGKTLGPFWGGVFSMFPTSLSSLCAILHWHYGPKTIFPTMQKYPIGALSIISYVLMITFTFPTYGFIIGTILSYATSLMVTWLLIRIQPKALTKPEKAIV